MKTCTVCHKPKPLSEYRQYKSGNYADKCKDCSNLAYTKTEEPVLLTWEKPGVNSQWAAERKAAFEIQASRIRADLGIK